MQSRGHNTINAIIRSGARRRILLWLVAIIPFLYMASCSYISSSRNKDFESINIGNARDITMKKIGAPSKRETSSDPFSRYASKRCQTPCAERLWYENRLTFDSEAWSVELDENGFVIKKSHWVSP